jgi:hypothetical protein
MKKLKGSAVEKTLKKAGGVFGDKGFIELITSPLLSASRHAVSSCNGNTSGTIG